jgi:hypothetical protein
VDGDEPSVGESVHTERLLCTRSSPCSIATAEGLWRTTGSKNTCDVQYTDL